MRSDIPRATCALVRPEYSETFSADTTPNLPSASTVLHRAVITARPLRPTLRSAIARATACGTVEKVDAG